MVKCWLCGLPLQSHCYFNCKIYNKLTSVHCHKTFACTRPKCFYYSWTCNFSFFTFAFRCVGQAWGWFVLVCLCVCERRRAGGLVRVSRLTERAEARLWREVCGNGNHLSYWSRCSQGSWHAQTHSHTCTHTLSDTNWLTYTQTHSCVAGIDPFILIPFTFP